MFRKRLLPLLAALLTACHKDPQASQVPRSEMSGKQICALLEADRQRESAQLTDADLKRMVEQLFIEEDRGHANVRGLRTAGRRAFPYLIEALNDPRTPTTEFRHLGFPPATDPPFQRICDLLSEPAPAEAAKPLARYVSHPDPTFRRQAASILATIGTPECLGPVTQALADSDDQVREFTLIGLAHGAARKGRNEAFFHAVIPILIPMLKAGDYEVENPAGVLTAIDAAEAAPILESPQYCSLKNPHLGQVLTALSRDDIKVPQSVVMPLLAQLEPLAAGDDKREWDYAAALLLYARSPDTLAQQRFEALAGSESPTVAEAGAKGLEILAGIDSHAAVWDAYEERGFARMTVPQKNYYAVEEYMNEVDNGGHRQYFSNDSGDLYRTAMEGLRVIGANSKIGILAGALQAFSPFQPALRNENRRGQMETFGAAQDRVLSTADQSFYASESQPGEFLKVLLKKYALQHKDDFRVAAGASRKADFPAWGTSGTGK